MIGREENYLMRYSMRTMALAAAILSLATTTSAGQLTIKGSDTMVILGQKWAEVYMQKTPATKIQVTGGGSGTGIAALINGTTDIAEASRPMKAEEIGQAESRQKRKVKEITVALDGLTVYVNKSSPVEALSLPQLRKIFTGQITNWKEIGGPDAPIVLYGRENNSGTYVFFKEHVLQNDDYSTRMQTMPGTASVVNAVVKDKNGIGYGGAAYAEGLKALKIRKDDLAPAVEGNMETVQSGRYGLSRGLYFYTFDGGSPELDQFVAWVLGPEGQQVVTDVGYFPVKK